jgi:hypothetical protein
MTRWTASWLIASLVLGGCYSVGHDFVRPPVEQFELKKTTQAQVLVAAGTPPGISHTERNGKRIERFQYAYFTAAGYAAGVGPVGRMASFYFSDGVLIGYLYSSSFPGESTDFAFENAARIEKGKSSRADVEFLLGKPHGVAIYPLIDDPGITQLRYHFAGATGAMGSGGTVSKDVAVALDVRGTVTEVSTSLETNKSR